MIYFYFPYFHVSNSDLFFLHGTLILSSYINVIFLWDWYKHVVSVVMNSYVGIASNHSSVSEQLPNNAPQKVFHYS